MFKLVVVSGPLRGASFQLKEGIHTIGRHSDSAILLSSSKISKTHCTIEINADKVFLRDGGSTNGTFLNGEKIIEREMNSGDQISIGNFVLQISQEAKSYPLAMVANGNPGQIDYYGGGSVGPSRKKKKRSGRKGASGGLHIVSAVPSSATAPPKDLKAKLAEIIELRLMPTFYGMMMKNEWKVVISLLFAALITVGVALSIQPLVDMHDELAIKTEEYRAQVLSRLLLDRNEAILISGQNIKAEIGKVEKEPGVNAAYILDIENRIIAPTSRINQIYSTGNESSLSRAAGEGYKNGKTGGITFRISESSIVHIEPLLVYDAAQGKNRVIAMSLVSVDPRANELDDERVTLVFASTLFTLGALIFLGLFIAYRMTLKPFEVLNEEVDKFLKGELSHITREFKMEDFDSLFEVINAALQRMPRGKSTGSGGGFAGSGSFEDPIAMQMETLKQAGDLAKGAWVVLDGDFKVVSMNLQFEQMTGIRMGDADGKDLKELARDQAFTEMLKELEGRTREGANVTATDYFEFTDGLHRLWVNGIEVFGKRGFFLMGVKESVL